MRECSQRPLVARVSIPGPRHGPLSCPSSLLLLGHSASTFPGESAMSIFGTIMNKIFHHASAPAAQSAPPASTQPEAGDTATVTATATAPAPAAPQKVDVGAVLSEMA